MIEFMFGLISGVWICVCFYGMYIDPRNNKSRLFNYEFNELRKQYEILQESMDELNRVFDKHINDGDGK